MLVALAAALTAVDNPFEGRTHRSVDLRDEVRVGLLGDDDLGLGLANLGNELVLELDDLDVGFLADAQCVEDDLLADLLGARLNHDDGVPAAGNREVELAHGELLERRIYNDFAVHVAHAGGGDGAVEGDLGNRQSGGSANDAEDVRLVDVVRGKDGDDDLDLIPHALGEPRAQGPVGQPRGEGGLGGGPAFAPEEAAWDATDRVQALLVLDGEREEVEALAHAAHDGGDENDSVSVSDDGGAVGLLCELAGLYRESPSGNLYLMVGRHT